MSVIEGRIENPVSHKIYFFTYPDSTSLYLGNKVAIDSSIIDSKGYYSFSLIHKTPYTFNLESDGRPLVPNLFLIPGGKMTIDFTGENNTPEVNSSGPESNYNKFLIQFLDSFYQGETKHEYYIATNYMDIHTFTEYNEKRKRKQLDFFNAYFKNDSLNKDFKDYAMNTIEYGIAVDRLMYLWKKRMKSENIFGDSAFFAFETPSFIENKGAFNCPAYIRFLNLYIKDEYERMVERGELPRDKSEKLVPEVEKYKLAMKLLNKPYCNVVIYNIFLSDMNGIGNENHAISLPANSLDSMEAWFRKKHSI